MPLFIIIKPIERKIMILSSWKNDVPTLSYVYAHVALIISFVMNYMTPLSHDTKKKSNFGAYIFKVGIEKKTYVQFIFSFRMRNKKKLLFWN